MKLAEVTDNNIDYAVAEGLIGRKEVVQAIQGLACLANNRLSPCEEPCNIARKNNNDLPVTGDLTPIPDPDTITRKLNVNCLKCKEFAPARVLLAKRVVQLTTSS